MKEYLIFSLFGIILFLETKNPLFTFKRDRWHHATQNISLKFFNMLVIYLLFSFGKMIHFKQPFELNLLHELNFPFWVQILATLLICDFFMYISHRFDHIVPILWRFHTVHHSDDFVDSTTSFRTHIFEVLVGNFLFVFFVFPVFGISLEIYFVYQIIFAIIDIFHHSNILVPKQVDSFLRLIIVSPYMHRLHHSNVKSETDSNFGSVFSFWDRLFKTYLIKDPKAIVFGLNEFSDPKWQKFTKMMIMPFSKIKE